jgi:DNA polymerase III delta prime subunit
MRIKAAPPDLENFDAGSEQAGDKDLAERLTQLLRNLEHGSVAIFDGRWGIGKTTFVKRWLAYLKVQGIPSIYLDAFAVDYLESPFVAIAGAFAKAGEEAKKAGHPNYKAFIDAAAKVGKSLGGTAAKIGVKAVTLGLIGSSEVEALGDVKDAVADALAERAESAVKEVIEQHAKKEKELTQLKDELSRFPALLSDIGDNAEIEVPPLVVVIDELDRCRPDFALGMVESIKHFFGTDKVHFILVTNREQLLLSVTHKYGSFTTADEYLRKFYDFQVLYEQDYSERGAVQIRHRIDELAESLLEGISPKERNDIIEYMRPAALAHRLTLRDLENVFLNLTLAYAAVRSNQFKPTLLITFLALLKTLDPSMFGRAKTGTLSYSDFAARMLAQQNWGQLDIERMRDVFRYHLDPDINLQNEPWSSFGNMEVRYNLGRLQTLQYLCNSVIDRFAPAQQA